MEIEDPKRQIASEYLRLYQRHLKAFGEASRLSPSGKGVVHTLTLPLYLIDGKQENVHVYLQQEQLSIYLKSMEQQASQDRAEVKLLEQVSELEKIVSNYKKPNPTETWISRWFAFPIACLFPKERREEWLGDLYEVNLELLHKGYPRWSVNLVNIGLIVILLMSGLSIKLSDLISLELGRIK
jgi:hypothetical protein